MHVQTDKLDFSYQNEESNLPFLICIEITREKRTFSFWFAWIWASLLCWQEKEAWLSLSYSRALAVPQRWAVEDAPPGTQVQHALALLFPSQHSDIPQFLLTWLCPI